MNPFRRVARLKFIEMVIPLENDLGGIVVAEKTMRRKLENAGCTKITFYESGEVPRRGLVKIIGEGTHYPRQWFRGNNRD